jgi:hypothetical protein
MRGSGAERRRNSHEKEKTHKPEEIIKKPREAEGLIAAGKGVEVAMQSHLHRYPYLLIRSYFIIVNMFMIF